MKFGDADRNKVIKDDETDVVMSDVISVPDRTGRQHNLDETVPVRAASKCVDAAFYYRQ